ncbi:LysR family transcriptional regulator [Plantactinospora sonchi]|uniref:LysR family transcriptional regulator n=1 Tax=Plantactinospora sonchi TaxID=1544735 RepID=A0ABU7S5G3_9ACTN
MDPHLLRTFLAVADCGSFSAAARRLGYTQSAVSQHIAALEQTLGVALLHRRPVGPTGAGERLREHAAAILLRLDAARADVRRASADPPGELRLGITPLAVPERVARALAVVRRSRPGLAVTVGSGGRPAVATGFVTGEYDVGLVAGVVAPSDPLPLAEFGVTTGVAVDEEPLVVLLPEGHPLAWRTGLRWDDLLDARWIDAPDVAASLPELCAVARSDGPRPTLRYDGIDLWHLLALVAAGHGLAVLPSSAVPAFAGVAMVPLTAPRLVHRTELLQPRDAGPVVAAFVAVLTEPSASPYGVRLGRTQHSRVP